MTTVLDGRTCGALIGRRDLSGVLRWLLPKGHVEPGETVNAAAIREVREETGIDGLVLAELGTVAYWFTTIDRRIHKTVHHYVMHAVGGELSDDDVEVDTVAWVPLDDVPARLSYADERRLAELVPGILADNSRIMRE